MVTDFKISENIAAPPTDLPLPAPSESAISIRNVSKMYPLYSQPSDRLKQSLWYALPSFLRGKPRQFYREFWALRDISFEVKKGETVGIIGRNGSGKSTLLQIIAGTLSPTVGEVQVNGRVAALLELGSGFNPEFTGRENVYLNGSILGLTQTEIDNIFDKILAFADIGQFIDQPVKHYSSGMFVRLAFAVQAFVPKEIFIIDEALAVGDEAFQRKCMATLERYRDNGGTVLLVSHNTQMIVRQCQRCIFLAQGELQVEGDSKPVTDLYQKLMYTTPQEITKVLATLRQQGLQDALNPSQDYSENENHSPANIPETTSPSFEPSDWFDANMPKTMDTSYGNGAAQIIDYGLYNQQGDKVNILLMEQRYSWRYRVKFHQDAHDVEFGMLLKTIDGVDVAAISSKREHVRIDYIPALTIVEVSFSIKLHITPGTYFLNAGVAINKAGELIYLHRRVDLCMIRVLAPDKREIRGIAYLEPKFNYTFIQKNPDQVSPN